MPAVSKLYVNCAAVGWTPSGGSLSSLTKITGVSIAKNSKSISFSGDNDRFNTFIANVMQGPTVSFTGGDAIGYFTIVSGNYGTATWTLCDAKNGTGSGSATFTLINAMIDDSSISGQHMQFAQGSLNIISYSSDGATNPLSYVFN